MVILYAEFQVSSLFLPLSPASGSIWHPDFQRLATDFRLQLSLPVLSFTLIPSASSVPYKIWRSHLLVTSFILFSINGVYFPGLLLVFISMGPRGAGGKCLCLLCYLEA